MVGADGADSWALGWGWNVAGHWLPSDGAGGVQVQPKKMFKEGDFMKISVSNPQAFNSSFA